jgi:hypothetical protein
VITRGVDPSIQIHYRASKLKQYFKEGRALRTETTINDTYDFGVGRLVKEENFRALRAVGEAANPACSSSSPPPRPALPTRTPLSGWSCRH